MLAYMEAVRDEDDDVLRDERERDTGGVSAWRNPQFLVQMLFLVGAIAGFYLIGERRTTSLEVLAVRIDGQVASMTAAVQTLTNNSIKQEGQIAGLTNQLTAEREARKEIERELKGEIAGLKAHIDVLRSGQAKLDARTERMR